MAPYYDEAERLWRVHGKRGVDPTEAGDEPPYAFPAIKHDPGIERLKTHLGDPELAALLPAAGVAYDDDHPVTTPCIKCKTCGGYPCLVRAKCDARTLAIEPLLGLPNVTLLTGRKAMRLETDAAGRTVQRWFARPRTARSAGAATSWWWPPAR